MDSFLPMTYGAVEDPVTLDERRAMALRAQRELGWTMPAVVDDMDDAVSRAYRAWPERLYLIAPDGTVAWRCGPGPYGFDPEGFGEAIGALLVEIEGDAAP